jgi:hypothetical protein
MDLFEKYNAINNLKSKYNIDAGVIYNRYNTLINNAIRQLLRTRNATIRSYIIKYNAEISQLKAKYNKDFADINSAGSPPISTLKKKALLIGLNYPGSAFQLSGCVNDINKIDTTLVEKFGFQSVVKLHDSSSILPTKVNILSQLSLLLSQSKSGDVLFFHYSGHGSQVKDINGDEADGLDEVMIPVDYFSNRSIITDDEIKGIIQNNLKVGVKLIVLMDCCHSGTIFDLRYNYDNNWNPIVNNNSIDTNGDVIVICGCSDPQTTFDTKLSGIYQGTTTWTFTNSLNNNTTWKQLINNMRQMLVKSNLSQQVPQISSGRPFNVDSVVVI